MLWLAAVSAPGSDGPAYARLLTVLAACVTAGGLGFALARLTTTRPPPADGAITSTPTEDLHELLPTGDLTELTQLAAYAERVRARLASSQQDRRQWEEAIEEIVEERTSELVALYERLRHKEELCKRLLGKVLTAQEQERARLARELHDEIGQSLTAMIMTTLVVENSLPPEYDSGREKLVNVRNMANQALNDLRGLIFDLRPEILDDLGLALALRSQIKKHLEPLGIEVQLRASGLRDSLPHEVETAVFRVVQEAITNIARHAQASQVSISLARQEGRLVVRVRDNGRGFDTTQVMNGARQAWGLLGMEERITLLGGRFYVSTRPGAGTLLLAEVPVDGEWVAAPAADAKERLGE
jgi:signal transduction histidine kinase